MEVPDEYYKEEVPLVDDSTEGAHNSKNDSKTDAVSKPTAVIIENDAILNLKVNELKLGLKIENYVTKA